MILTSQEYLNEKGETNFKLCVYLTNNGFVCDINVEYSKVNNFFQMKMEM